MSKPFNYISVKTVLGDAFRDLPSTYLQETDMIEWTANALEHIQAPGDYEEMVAWLEVTNHQVEMPDHLRYIIQLAKNNCWSSTDLLSVQEVLDCLDDTPDNPPTEIDPGDSIFCVTYPKILDCRGNILGDYHLSYYRTRFEHNFEYYGFVGTKYYQRCFTPIRLTEHTFFNSVVCTENNADQLYSTCQDEYTIAAPYLRFSFASGQVALSYLKWKLDEDGYPMIPDAVQYRDAIVAYFNYKVQRRRFYSDEIGEGKFDRAERDWHWRCQQAKNYSMSLRGVDDLQNVYDQRNYLLPHEYRYHNFYGNQNTPENRIYNRSHSRL